MFSTCGLTGLLGTLYLLFPTIAGLETFEFTGLFVGLETFTGLLVGLETFTGLLVGLETFTGLLVGLETFTGLLVGLETFIGLLVGLETYTGLLGASLTTETVFFIFYFSCIFFTSLIYIF